MLDRGGGRGLITFLPLKRGAYYLSFLEKGGLLEGGGLI